LHPIRVGVLSFVPTAAEITRVAGTDMIGTGVLIAIDSSTFQHTVT